jgi:hypothetical protein
MTCEGNREGTTLELPGTHAARRGGTTIVLKNLGDDDDDDASVEITKQSCRITPNRTDGLILDLIRGRTPSLLDSCIEETQQSEGMV